MSFFYSKKRPDGKLVRGGDPMMHIFPYIMRGRNESCIYYRNTIDVDILQTYIRQKRREGKRITLFNLIITATLHLIFERPKLNRFVSGRRLYAHNSFDVLYVVKTSLTDDAVESVARVSFDENDDLFTTSKAMEDIITQIKEGKSEKWDDKLISYFARFPRWFLRFVMGFLRIADFHGKLPKQFLQMIPMYSSIFVSHLGSIGGGSPFHHLYEFGTTSIFLTIGKVYEVPHKAGDGGIEWRKVVDLCFTIDERICDGFYLVKSLKMLNTLLEYPELLEYSPAAVKRLTPEELRELKRKFSAQRKGEEWPMRQEEIADQLEMYGTEISDILQKEPY